MFPYLKTYICSFLLKINNINWLLLGDGFWVLQIYPTKKNLVLEITEG
jgi:hypothetical protein